jgi:hypothetical protein
MAPHSHALCQQLFSCDTTGDIKLHGEVLSILQDNFKHWVPRPVSMTGRLRGGKSTFLNSLVKQEYPQCDAQDFFTSEIGDSSVTKGVWVFVKPIPTSTPGVGLMLFDCEGTEGGNEKALTQLYLLYLSLVAVFMINVREQFGTDILRYLATVSEEANNLRIQSNMKPPTLYLILRDKVVDDLILEKQPLTHEQYLQKILEIKDDDADKYRRVINPMYDHKKLFTICKPPKSLTKSRDPCAVLQSWHDISTSSYLEDVNVILDELKNEPCADKFTTIEHFIEVLINITRCINSNRFLEIPQQFTQVIDKFVEKQRQEFHDKFKVEKRLLCKHNYTHQELRNLLEKSRDEIKSEFEKKLWDYIRDKVTIAGHLNEFHHKTTKKIDNNVRSRYLDDEIELSKKNEQLLAAKLATLEQLYKAKLQSLEDQLNDEKVTRKRDMTRVENASNATATKLEIANNSALANLNSAQENLQKNMTSLKGDLKECQKTFKKEITNVESSVEILESKIGVSDELVWCIPKATYLAQSFDQSINMGPTALGQRSW